jgi:hypothetical protein
MFKAILRNWNWFKIQLRKFYRQFAKFDVSGAIFFFNGSYRPYRAPGLFFSSVIIFTQTVELLGRVISPSQGRYLYTGQPKHRINAYTDIHVLSGIRTPHPNVRASEDGSCLRPCGHCDRRVKPCPADILPHAIFLRQYCGLLLRMPLWCFSSTPASPWAGISSITTPRRRERIQWVMSSTKRLLALLIFQLLVSLLFKQRLTELSVASL